MNKRVYIQTSLLLVIIMLFSFCFSPFYAYAKDIKINRVNKAVNEPFEINNMFPGDSHNFEYVVNLKHKDLAVLCFSAKIKEDSNNLVNALNMKVEITNKGVVLYDGPMSSMPEKVTYNVNGDESVHNYKITVSLPASAGNEYQYAKLVADFMWWYEPYEEVTSNGGDVESDSGVFPWNDFSPSTGIVLNILVTIGFVAMVTLIIIIPIMLVKKRKKKDE